MRISDIGRRRFLNQMASVLVLGSAYSVFRFNRILLPFDLSLLIHKNRRILAGLGRTYLQQFPHEADIQLLREAIESPWLYSLIPGFENERFVQKVKQDFRDGLVVQIEGWFLARSEARLSALCALME